MRNVSQLLTVVRTLSKNLNYNQNGTEGIVDEQFIQAFNDAQDYLQAALNAKNPANGMFQSQSIIPIVAGQEAYTIPARLFFNKEIALVEFSNDGQTSNYIPLDKRQLFNRNTYPTNWYNGYYVRNGQINLIPIPSSSVGSLRVTYEKKLDNLDRSRGTINTITGLTSTSFTSFTITAPDEVSNPNFTTIDYISVSDPDGNPRCQNIPVGSYVAGTDTLTPRAGYVFQTGETLVAGDTITFGKYTTPVSKLFDECEAFLIHYANESILHADSSDDVVKESSILNRILDGILTVMSQQSPESQMIPQRIYDEWW